MISIVTQLKNAQKETGIYIDDISSEQFDNIKMKIFLNLKIKINDTSNFIWQDFPEYMNICGEYAWKVIPKILDKNKRYILFFNQIECKKAYRFDDADNLCTIIGETYDFEFYITDLDGSFILCFNHEEILCGCGNITNKMKEYRTSLHKDSK